MKAADLYLSDCFAQESPPHVNELAQKAGMSAAHFSRTFVAANGVAPSAYLKAGCIARARDLLRNTTKPLDEVASQSGFGTRASFFRAFRRWTEETPAAYRQSVTTGETARRSGGETS